MNDQVGSDPALPALSLEAISAQYERLLQRLEANEREFRRLGRAVWRVQEDERRRLARDLHDGLGQNLTALKHRLSQVADDLDGDVRIRIDAAIALCAETLEDTRHLSRLLRPPILDDLGLVAALRWLARSQSESAGIEVVAEIVEWENRLKIDYRIHDAASGEVITRAHTIQVAVRLDTGEMQMVSPPVLLQRLGLAP